MKTFEKELPDGYEEALVVDATKKKFAVIFNLISILLAAGITLLGYFLIKPSFQMPLWKPFFYLACMVGYIVLHELVHGVAYKALTGQKLTFGMTLSVAFCGVPTIYVYRKTALVALLAPFVVFSLLFGLLVGFLPNGVDRFFFTFLLGLHLGGCSGDLYCTGLYLFKFRDPATLMQDTGPKQTFYSLK